MLLTSVSMRQHRDFTPKMDGEGGIHVLDHYIDFVVHDNHDILTG